MRVLFLTTAEIPLLQEHYFTINVALGLKKLYSTHDDDQITYASLQFRPGITPHISKLENQSIDTYSIYIDNSCSHEKLITDIAQQLTKLKPDIIHSQLLDGYDIEAASIMRTPIFNTIHVGGFICPRSTINGFLRPNDSICNLSVGPQCKECMYQELPFPKIAEALHPIVSHGKFGNFLSNHQPPIFYLTPLAKINENLSIRRNLFPIFNKSNIIAANKQLVELLKINGIHDLVHYLPHGVKERRRLEFPTVKNGKIHFYILNRIQHCKGVHIVLEALKGIPKDKYELHIIGGYPPSIMGKQYFHKIKHMAKGLNVNFYGQIPNNEIDDIIKNCHVMIHATICHEVYGIAIAESLSIGRPVIATRCGGAEEQVQDGVNGWLIEPNDVGQMRAAILNVIENANTLPQYAQRCKIPHPLDEYIIKLDELYRISLKDNKED